MTQSSSTTPEHINGRRADALPENASPRPLTPDERNALRAFLQRCEVRLSTLHRIALSFIGGAGLLLLIPVFFKDVVADILATLLVNLTNQFPQMGYTGGGLLTAALIGAVLYPLMLSLVIPLYGVYLLLMDVVHFYFTIYMPGSAQQVLNPTFSLSGLTFWSDESPDLKHQIMHYQYLPHQMDYMLPFSDERRATYFNPLIANTNGEIIPATRKLETLTAAGILPADANLLDVQHFNAAFGIARSLDRTLIEDVATTEMTIARYVLYLRRLMLRYVKTLLMFIWTTVVSFMMLPFLHDDRFSPFLVLSLGYLVWSLAVVRLMRLPLTWIYRHRKGEEIDLRHVDAQLTLLERRVTKYCQIAVPTAVIALLLALVSVFM